MLFAKYILISFILFIPSGNINNCHTNKNFSFEYGKWSDLSWITSSNGGVFLRDTLNFVEGNQSLLLTKKPFSFGFNSYVFQYFNLPIEPKKIELSIYSKSEIVDSAWLKLYCLDKYENMTLKDSILIGKHREWMKYSLTVFPLKTEKLYIEIQAKSKDTVILDKKITQRIWIDYLQLKLDGRDIVNYQHPDFQFYREDIEEMNENIKVDENNLYKLYNIDDFKNHRIIAFGESVHGCKEIQHFTFESIKYFTGVY